MRVHVVGGGLAGCEAAWQLLKNGHEVLLHEQRPLRSTPAHKTHGLCELVCSNSFKSMDPSTPSGRLKEEMRLLDSLILEEAEKSKIPSGMALAVDRHEFSLKIESRLLKHPAFSLIREEITSFKDDNELWIIATGPLTHPELEKTLAALMGEESLYFYDAIAPIFSSDTLDLEFMFEGDRYNRSFSEEGAGYLNIPLDRDVYENLVSAILDAEKVALHSFEKPRYFESCLPLEVLASRGKDTLRFGPWKPVGLKNPQTGKSAFANIQLRWENQHKTACSLVAGQTKMTWPEQKRIFSMIPGLQNVEFLRYGSIHRNTYVCSPKCLNPDFSLQSKPGRIFLAGQITGVEGYLESAAIGLLVGKMIGNPSMSLPPPSTMLGALANYVLSGPCHGDYSPTNIHFGLLPPLEKPSTKALRRQAYMDRGQKNFENWHNSFLA